MQKAPVQIRQETGTPAALGGIRRLLNCSPRDHSVYNFFALFLLR